MRNGQILVEESPKQLVDTNRCKLLEEAVLLICKKRDNDKSKEINTANTLNDHVTTFSTSWHKPRIRSHQVIPSSRYRQSESFDSEMGKPKANAQLVSSSSNNLYSTINRAWEFSKVLFLCFVRVPA